MKTEKISDVLQGMDVNTEDAIVTLSDKVWEIGELSEITTVQRNFLRHDLN